MPGDFDAKCKSLVAETYRMVCRTLVSFSSAGDERTHEERCFRKLALLERRNREAGGADGVECRAVAIATTGREAAEPVEAILPSRHFRIVGSHVLDKQQMPS